MLRELAGGWERIQRKRNRVVENPVWHHIVKRPVIHAYYAETRVRDLKLKKRLPTRVALGLEEPRLNRDVRWKALQILAGKRAERVHKISNIATALMLKC